MKGRKLNKFAHIRKIKNINNINLHSRVPDNDLVIIEGCTENGKSLRILVDNGSQAELISESAARDLNKNIIKSNTTLTTAQGAGMNILGQVDLNLKIAEHEFNFPAQVVSQLSPLYDIIVGMAFLNDNTTCLKTRPGHTPKFCIGDTEIPILSDKRRSGMTILNIRNLESDAVDFAKSASTIFIKPRSKGCIKLAIPANEKLHNDKLIYFEA